LDWETVLDEQAHRLIANYDELDAQLSQHAEEARERFETAVRVGDASYMAEWIEWRAASWYRTHLRSAYQSAHYRTGQGRPLADLRWYDVNLADDVQKVVAAEIERIGRECHQDYEDKVLALRQAARDAVK
jgi:hypothetical protein